MNGNEELKECIIELTDQCPHFCVYCSSDAGPDGRLYLTYEQTKRWLNEKGPKFDLIRISGGEPLSHPDFYALKLLCDEHSDSVFVHTNLLQNIVYNATVIPGVDIWVELPFRDNVKGVHFARMVRQGREKLRLDRLEKLGIIAPETGPPGPPNIHFSRNWSEDCECDTPVLKPDGTTAPSPCKKDVLMSLQRHPSMNELKTLQKNGDLYVKEE